jgi:hypothetical protein
MYDVGRLPDVQANDDDHVVRSVYRVREVAGSQPMSRQVGEEDI